MTVLPKRGERRSLLAVIRRSQSGLVLVVSLLVLMALTMFSVSAMRIARMNERMAGNAQTQSRAFNAAESGLSAAMQSTEAWDLNGYEIPLEALPTASDQAQLSWKSSFIGWSPPRAGSLYGATRFKAANFDIGAIGKTPDGTAMTVHGGAFQIAPK